MSKTAADVSGYEYDWLACDAHGHVAFFSTAGGSFAPAEFLRDTDAHDRAIEALMSLPPHTQPLTAPTLNPALSNPWAELARRGLFAFDGTFNGGNYTRVSVPERPIHLASLPRAISEVASRVVLIHADFSVDQHVSEESLAPTNAPAERPA